MSLCIDSRYITGIYALGQWFKVVPDTFGIDAYQLTDWDDTADGVGSRHDTGFTDYEMGALYLAVEPAYESGQYENLRGTWETPHGCAGVSFIDADTSERVSFSLMEVKGFREKRP